MNDPDTPVFLYAVQWRSRQDPDRSGISWASGTYFQPGTPFATREQAEQEALKLQVNQTTEILVWKLV